MFLLASPAFAFPLDCERGVSAEYEFALMRAEAAIVTLDPEELDDATRLARDLLRCVEKPLGPLDVARLYRLGGIAKFVTDDWVGASVAFGVARAIAPETTLPVELGAPIRRLWDAIPPPTGQTAPLPPPSEGRIVIDGAAATTFPTDRAYVVQWMRDDGSVRSTWIVEKGGVPGYPEAVEPPPKGRRRGQ